MKEDVKTIAKAVVVGCIFVWIVYMILIAITNMP
jgi:hypothetical protein